MLLLEFLAVGAWGFWVVLAIASIIASEMLDTSHPGYATFVVVVTLVGLSVLGNLNPIGWLSHNPWSALWYIIAYFGVGSLWCVGKWAFWLNKSKRKIQEIRAEYPNKALSELSYTLRSRNLPVSFPPKVGDYKSRIIGWMALWPASMVWTVLNDPVRLICEEIYACLGGLMQRISNRIFKDFDTTP